MNGPILVVGIGNDYRRDDGVGPAVARQVAAIIGGTGQDTGAGGMAGGGGAAGGGAVEVLAGVADPLDLLGRWDDATLTVVVDAVRSGAPAGTVSTIELADSDAGGTSGGGRGATSTHGSGLVGVLRLARAVRRAPERVVLVTVEAVDLDRGEGLHPAVAAAMPEAVRRVLDAVGSAGVRARGAAPGPR